MTVLSRRHLLGGLAAGVAMSTLGAAPARAASNLTIWHHGGRGGDERAVMEDLVKAWNAANPSATAELVLLPEGSYNEQVQAAALAGQLPDLLDFDGPNYANYAWAGYLQPLNGLLSQAVIDNALPSIIQQGTYAPDGKLYSIGQFDSGLALWASKSMLEKAGVRIPTGLADAWTGAEFEEALGKLKASGVATPLDLKLNYGKGEWYTYGFSPIIQSHGGDLINRTTWRATGTLDGDGAVAGLAQFQGWIKNSLVVPASAGDDSFYGKRTSAIAYVGHWMSSQHRQALGDDLLLLPIPKFGPTHVTGMGSWCWGITRTARDPALAARFVEFILSDENVVNLISRLGGVPGTKTAAAKSEVTKPGAQQALYVEQLNAIAVPRPAHPAYPVITASFAQAVADMIDGADPKAALTKAAEAIDLNIEDNQGYPPFGQ